MPGPLTAQEREVFLAEPHVGVLSIATGVDQPPHTTPFGMRTSRAAISPSSRERKGGGLGSPSSSKREAFSA